MEQVATIMSEYAPSKQDHEHNHEECMCQQQKEEMQKQQYADHWVQIEAMKEKHMQQLGIMPEALRECNPATSSH